MEFIGNKRKNDQINLDIKNIEKEKKTVIKFYLINANNNFYDHIEFQNIKQTFDLKNLIKNKTQEIFLNLTDNINIKEYYFIEKIKLFKNNNFIEYNITIYLNQLNQFAISLNNNDNNNYTLELYYYSKANKLPNELFISNKEIYTNYDNFNIKYRRRFNFINISKEIISYLDNNLNFNNFPSSLSYKVCYRNKKFSIFLIKQKKIIKKMNFDEVKKIEYLDKFKDFSKEIKNLINNENYDVFANNFIIFNEKYNNFSSYIIELENFYDNLFIDEIELIKENDISIIILLFYFSIFKYITNIFNKLETINEIQFKLAHYLNKLKYLINLFEDLINEINKNEEEIKNKCKDLIRYKFCLIRCVFFKVKEILKRKNFLSVLIDFDILILSKLNANNCYIKSIDFLKKIVQNLNEDSILFDIFLQFDSEILIDLNLIELNDISKVIHDSSNFQNSKNSLFEINLLTVEQVKSHLFNLIPNIFLRYLDDGDNKYGYFDKKNVITLINEYYLLEEDFNLKSSENILNKDNKYKYYSMPISMNILHENFTHAKIQLTNGNLIETPTKTFDSNNNFNNIIYEVQEINGNELIKYGEAGKNLEMYISQGNNYIINYLYSIQYDNSDIFEDLTYWTDTSFERLTNNLKEKIANEEKNLTKIKYYKFNNFEKKKKHSKYFKS